MLSNVVLLDAVLLDVVLIDAVLIDAVLIDAVLFDAVLFDAVFNIVVSLSFKSSVLCSSSGFVLLNYSVVHFEPWVKQPDLLWLRHKVCRRSL